MPIRETFGRRKKLCVGLISKKLSLLVISLCFIVILSGCVGQNPVGTPAATTPVAAATTPVATTAAPKTQTLVTKSPLEMLPTRDDLSSEWTFPSGSGSSFDSCSPVLYIGGGESPTGCISGASTSLAKYVGTTRLTAGIAVYKYDSVENANNNYQTMVNWYKQSSGYTELSTYGVGATCYAGASPLIGQAALGGISNSIYCVKNNVVFFVFTMDLKGGNNAIEIAKIVSSKIS